MTPRSAADFYALPLSKRRAIMLKVAKDATEMQRAILRKAAKMKKARAKNA